MSRLAEKVSRGVYVICEIGGNHAGSFETANRMIATAAACGVDAVKLQKRDIESMPAEMRNRPRTDAHAFGETEYEHRRFLEFDVDQHRQLKAYANGLGLDYGLSTWDYQSTRDIVSSDCADWLKVPSAKAHDVSFITHAMEFSGGTLLISTGMLDGAGVVRAVRAARDVDTLCVLQCTSAYPCEAKDVNLFTIRDFYGLMHAFVVGLSGHHRGIQIDAAAVALGARVIERHFTLDRTSKGTDHAASLEPDGMRRLCRDVQIVYEALGDGVKRVMPCEEAAMRKLRG